MKLPSAKTIGEVAAAGDLTLGLREGSSPCGQDLAGQRPSQLLLVPSDPAATQLIHQQHGVRETRPDKMEGVSKCSEVPL
eukprot:CAMPEP_0117683000 /NCGR_PEP_ID=MMETSP0804-20121206/20070_1 /TAXON_ID=1074897 /ORGANISM="Tetraselmis astigmatica, Strain CCMP880" /LENGTH=79 /DNA_ID=CAMNT_0005493371 /DNA_START=606 /DNA_END=845 /DNA_ORIENTATION=-